MIVKIYTAILLCLIVVTGCDLGTKQKPHTIVKPLDDMPTDKKSSKTTEDSLKKADQIIFSSIDTVSLQEIRNYVDPKKSIFEYYAIEEFDEIEIWSDKMFGRCCTEADLSYAELLDFEITANVNNPLYTYENLSDRAYRTAYAFKESQNVEIYVQLNTKSDWHESQTNLSVNEVLKSNDTLLKPFFLSLVNGYVKSEKTFKENARVHEMEILLNGMYKATVVLQDTPLVQEFELDITFKKNDRVTLIPSSYYNGSKYDDVCISEIQSSLSQIAHPSINNKYNVHELWNIENAIQKIKK